MKYNKIVILKDGRACTIRNGTERDGQAVLDIFLLTHAQTDYLLTYPDETGMTVNQEAEFLKGRTESDNEIELLAEVGGTVVGSAGIGCVGKKDKIKHRAEFGISVDKAYWGLGIGRALTEACIECARAAGYAQLELEVVADNQSALKLYESVGFVEYGRNPRGFLSRLNGWQELVLMRLELTDLYKKLAAAEQQIEDGAEGNDFCSLAGQLRGNVQGNSRHTVIGKTVKGVIDRPLGSHHPRYPDMVYPINYGYVEGVMAGDGAEQDVYVFGADKPIETFEGTVIAVYHRLNDVEDKWIVSLDEINYSDEEILRKIHFQEQYFDGILLR